MSYNFPSAMNSSTNPNPSIPEVGYRFHPTNEELVCNYLKPKILGDDVEDLSIMPVVHVCKHEPSELPDKSNIKSKDAVWYFFCPRDFKYLNSGRYNRRTKLGFWKPTGKILKIRFTGTKKVIGTRKTLVFYTKACPKPIRTGWIMHEYEYSSDLSPCNQGGYVLCKLKKKPEVRTNKSEPNHHMVSISDFEAAPNCSIEGECGPTREMPSKFMNHSTHGYGDSSLLDLDSENPNLDISAPDEGERNSLTVLPSGLENGNPWEKTEEGCLLSSVVSPENSPPDAWLPDFSLLAKLKALISELENNLPSFQPAASVSTEEIPFHMGFDAPVST
ncbi:PREDICTED: NAC domain-containing protein 45-like isoform X2 [Populus euphratica]|uniref:NAC domain-containing protein 45-like isoform X2 n=1 Tax=Populus euphratica TaxID=75702 RepID=A0AAJ6V307_POPEU|nr:PREDICTED: NAC domain-containing protein 45-like isoform X2 [Populus euphratica]